MSSASEKGNQANPYGFDNLTFVDRFGVWLSYRKIRKLVGDVEGKVIADIGSGFDATLAMTMQPQAEKVFVCDFDLNDRLDEFENVVPIRHELPAALEAISDDMVDVLFCVSVLEHIEDIDRMLSEFFRVVRPGGSLFLNVPSWRGKFFLELSAFRLGLSPSESIDDHKMYFDPKDLWPLLVRSGFRPKDIKVGRHKFGLNTFSLAVKA